MVEESASNLLTGSVFWLSLSEKNAVWVLKHSQAELAGALVKVSDHVKAGIKHHRPHKSSLGSHSDLFYDVLHAYLPDRYLGLKVVNCALVLGCPGVFQDCLKVGDFFLIFCMPLEEF